MSSAFRDNIAWQRGIDLTICIYRLTAFFPATERYGLTSQLRRASVSVPSNIAEGYGQSTRGAYVLYLGYARGSNCEVSTQLTIARSLGYGPEAILERAESLSAEVNRLLHGLIRALKAP